MPLRGGGVGMRPARVGPLAEDRQDRHLRPLPDRRAAGARWLLPFPAANGDADLTALADLAHQPRQADALYRSGPEAGRGGCTGVTAGHLALARYAQNSAAAAGSGECGQTSGALPVLEALTWTRLS